MSYYNEYNSEPPPDYSKLMNTWNLIVIRKDNYSHNLPKYFTGIRNDLPVLNGEVVSYEEFNNHEGVTEKADDSLIRHSLLMPGNENDMVMANATPAIVVDMTINDIEYKIPNKPDLEKLLDILINYRNQLEPYKQNNRVVENYLGYVNRTILALQPILTNWDEYERNQRKQTVLNDPDHVLTLNEMIEFGYF